MVLRSAWATMALGGAVMASSGCGAYPDRVYPAFDASVGSAGSLGTGGGGGSGGGSAGGSGGSSNNTGGGDASVLVDAAKDALSPMDAKADVDRQVCKMPGAHPGLDCRCADGTVEDAFNKNLVGCADTPDLATATTWAQRAASCGPSCTVATVLQWVSTPGHGNLQPHFNYWLDDDLVLTSGTMSGMCAVNKRPAMGNDTCLGQPMHVCVPSANGGRVTDPVGATCDLHDCGFETLAPNNYFGGCTTNRTAGTLCYCP